MEIVQKFLFAEFHTYRYHKFMSILYSNFMIDGEFSLNTERDISNFVKQIFISTILVLKFMLQKAFLASKVEYL